MDFVCWNPLKICKCLKTLVVLLITSRNFRYSLGVVRVTGLGDWHLCCHIFNLKNTEHLTRKTKEHVGDSKPKDLVHSYSDMQCFFLSLNKQNKFGLVFIADFGNCANSLYDKNTNYNSTATWNRFYNVRLLSTFNVS